MTHTDAQELTALYVLGAVAGSEREAFEAHVATCAECQREVASLRPVSIGLLQAVPERTPSPALRQRVLDAAIGRRASPDQRRLWSRSPVLQWLTTAAALAIAVAAVIVSARTASRARAAGADARNARVQAVEAESRASDAQRKLAAVAAQLDVLTAPDVVRVELTGQQPAPSAVARAYWSRSRGLVFTASHLPPAPPNRTYQLWVVTAAAPISAGLLTTTSTGDVSAMFNTPSDIPTPVAMAVTLEPEGGVPAPTGDKYLVGIPPR